LLKMGVINGLDFAAAGIKYRPKNIRMCSTSASEKLVTLKWVSRTAITGAPGYEAASSAARRLGGMLSLTRRQRVRRVGILCCHYLRNCAYYKAGWDGKTARRKEQFWRGVNANFMDLCTLEFCKLFAEARGKHHWRKVITDQPKFLAGLLTKLKMPEAEFNEYIVSMKFYRDKYVAHLDDELEGKYPVLGPGKTAAAYLFDYLLEHEDEGGFFPDAGGTSIVRYQDWKEEAEDVYR
jgi:hypothetical protein